LASTPKTLKIDTKILHYTTITSI